MYMFNKMLNRIMPITTHPIVCFSSASCKKSVNAKHPMMTNITVDSLNISSLLRSISLKGKMKPNMPSMINDISNDIMS